MFKRLLQIEKIDKTKYPLLFSTFPGNFSFVEVRKSVCILRSEEDIEASMY
jgi:hypothetical protein